MWRKAVLISSLVLIVVFTVTIIIVCVYCICKKRQQKCLRNQGANNKRKSVSTEDSVAITEGHTNHRNTDDKTKDLSQNDLHANRRDGETEPFVCNLWVDSDCSRSLPLEGTGKSTHLGRVSRHNSNTENNRQLRHMGIAGGGCDEEDRSASDVGEPQVSTEVKVPHGENPQTVFASITNVDGFNSQAPK